ncbi:unnamed protein product, partial [marine sediment metagenome]
GTIKDTPSGRSTDYWKLYGGRSFGRLVTGSSRPKPANEYTILGGSNPRLDAAAKVSGQTTYIHDLELPDMVHGRVLRPANQSAKLLLVDEYMLDDTPGLLKIVRDGSFLGVICEQEHQAVKALEHLEQAAKWEYQVQLPDQDRIYADLLSQPGQSYLVDEGTPVEGSI